MTVLFLLFFLSFVGSGSVCCLLLRRRSQRFALLLVAGWKEIPKRLVGGTSGIVSLLQKYVLGGQTMAAGGNAVAVDPQPGHLCEAEGVIPTAKGPVKIRWSKKGRQLRLDVKAPGGVKVKKQSKSPSV